MTWREPARRGAERVELMDAGEGSPAEIAGAYRDLERVNRHLGGYRATLDVLDALPDAALWPAGAAGGRPGDEHRFTILDVAGGDGGFAGELVEWAARRGYDARGWVVDLSATSVRLTRERREHRIGPVQGDALALPFGDRSVDLAHCSAFFHHLSTFAARDALAEMCRVSRRLVIVNDLVRSWVATGAIWGITRVLSNNRLVRADGPLSVLKAFAPRELESLARAAGATDAPDFRWRLTRTFPYRMALLGLRTGGDSPAPAR